MSRRLGRGVIRRIKMLRRRVLRFQARVPVPRLVEAALRELKVGAAVVDREDYRRGSKYRIR